MTITPEQLAELAAAPPQGHKGVLIHELAGEVLRLRKEVGPLRERVAELEAWASAFREVKP